MGLVPIIQRGDDVRALGVDSRFRSGIYQRRSAALNRLGRKLQVGRRNGNGLCQIQMIRACGIFTSRLFIFNRAHRFSFLFCSSASPKSHSTIGSKPNTDFSTGGPDAKDSQNDLRLLPTKSCPSHQMINYSFSVISVSSVINFSGFGLIKKAWTRRSSGSGPDSPGGAMSHVHSAAGWGRG
jgi:hypothetical protein